jgi:hypothetical protein
VCRSRVGVRCLAWLLLLLGVVGIGLGRRVLPRGIRGWGRGAWRGAWLPGVDGAGGPGVGEGAVRAVIRRGLHGLSSSFGVEDELTNSHRDLDADIPLHACPLVPVVEGVVGDEPAVGAVVAGDGFSDGPAWAVVWFVAEAVAEGEDVDFVVVELECFPHGYRWWPQIGQA